MRRLLGGLVVAVLALGACGDDDDDGGDAAPTGGDGSTVAVRAEGFAFDPTAAEVAAGAVHFEITNADDTAHTFTIDDAGVDIDLPASDTGEGDADLDAGEYEWRCTIHPAMTGTLTVS